MGSFQGTEIDPIFQILIGFSGLLFLVSFSDKEFTLGEQTPFSALVSPAEKIAFFSAGETRAERLVCSPQASEHIYLC